MGWKEVQWTALGDSALITEKRFVQAFNSFWNASVPRISDYVRQANMSPGRYSPPLESASTRNRGLINEAGFRIFGAAVAENVSPSTLAPTTVTRAAADALDFIRRFRADPSEELTPLAAGDLVEAALLADRIARFVRYAALQQAVLAWPRFPGCGIVDACSGDLLIGDTLCEVKAGDVGFRGRDVRQVLVYGALNWISKSYPLSQFCILNPRHGTYLGGTLDELCEAVAGCGSLQIFDEITQYLLEPHWRDEAV